MSKFRGFVGEEKPLLPLLLLTIAAEALEPPDGVEEDEEEDLLPLADGEVGVKLQEALTPAVEWMLLLMLWVMLLLLVIRSDTTVL